MFTFRILTAAALALILTVAGLGADRGGPRAAAHGNTGKPRGWKTVELQTLDRKKNAPQAGKRMVIMPDPGLKPGARTSGNGQRSPRSGGQPTNLHPPGFNPKEKSGSKWEIGELDAGKNFGSPKSAPRSSASVIGQDQETGEIVVFLKSQNRPTAKAASGLVWNETGEIPSMNIKARANGSAAPGAGGGDHRAQSGQATKQPAVNQKAGSAGSGQLRSEVSGIGLENQAIE